MTEIISTLHVEVTYFQQSWLRMAMSYEKVTAWLCFPGNLKTKANPLVTFNTPQNSTNCANNMFNGTRLAELA